MAKNMKVQPQSINLASLKRSKNYTSFFKFFSISRENYYTWELEKFLKKTKCKTEFWQSLFSLSLSRALKSVH